MTVLLLMGWLTWRLTKIVKEVMIVTKEKKVKELKTVKELKIAKGVSFKSDLKR